MEWEPFIRLLAAAGFAGAIGLDRELRAKPAGLRTNIVVGVAAGAFTYAGLDAFPAGDPSRVAAQIVSGIGFLGGGAIFAAGGKPHGLTTAAALWGSAAAGLAAGVGAFTTGLALVAVTVLALWPLDWAADSLLASRRRTNVRIAVVVRDLPSASRTRALLGHVGLRVDQLEMRPFAEQGIAMELVVHATRAHLQEAVGRLCRHDDVLFVSEEAVPRDGQAGLRSGRRGARSDLQAGLDLSAGSDLPPPRRARQRGASSNTETTRGHRGWFPHVRQAQQPLTTNNDGPSRRSSNRVLLQPSHSTRLPDSTERPSDEGKNMSRDPGAGVNDPFPHLRQAGMKRLSPGRQQAILRELELDLWEPPAGLLLHHEAPLQARIILGGFRVYDIVPRRFQAYARVLHPFKAAGGSPVRTRLAGKTDGPPHRIRGDARLTRVRAAAAPTDVEPLIGLLDRPTAVDLAELLRRHTKTPEAVYFLFRAGLAELGHGPWDVLYEAPIDLIGSFYPYGREAYLSPILWWDAGGEWFVATYPDASSTYLGGSARLVRELSMSQKVEAVEVTPQAFVDVVSRGQE